MQRLLWLLLVVAAAPLHAQTTHYADTAGHCDGLTPCHTTVMQAVASAVEGDRIEVFPGRYTESVVIDDATGLTLLARAAEPTDTLTCTVTPSSTKVEFTERFTVNRQERMHVEGFTFLAGAVFGPGAELTFMRNVVPGGLSLRMCFSTVIRHNRLASLDSEAAGNCTITDNSFTGSGLLFTSQNNSSDTVIADNVFLAGDIVIQSERQREIRIETNRLYSGSMVFSAQFQFDDVVIEGNVIDAGGLQVQTESGARNLVTENRVFDSDGDGIFMEIRTGLDNDIIGNTSRGHAGCDIRDVPFAGVDNNWSDNDFDTACGSADG